ncbi:hypothetical protein HPB48_010869 [Haemaphysalis longicornis]|uniref:Transposable element P transposase-like RNase H C-terminal domain-containing protein n=1 Tax=Haemaphysalis longicornis TaxID=44386 RepID=A0A9J6GJ72_HAELO|nr:hypothetical protein HPB48_010869 [Haemaphysalis longicornis]
MHSPDLEIVGDGLDWLNEWDKELQTGAVTKDIFLTKSTAEGLRVTLASTRDLCHVLLTVYNFRYVLASKFNQDPIERFFGKIRLAGSQNDHPSMPTFLQLYQTLSIYSILKYGDCSVVEGKTALLVVSDFRALISTDEQLTSTDFVAQVKEKLDNLVSADDWDCEEVIRQHGGDVTEVTDCIFYYVTGFICRKMRKVTTCAACLSAFRVKTNTSTAAALTNAKTRGGLTHPTVGIFNLFKHAERLFVDYADWNTVYWDTIDGVLDTYTLTFPCCEHKEEAIAQLLHYYVSMRMRQHCQHVNGALKKQSQEKKKLAKLCSS